MTSSHGSGESVTRSATDRRFSVQYRSKSSLAVPNAGARDTLKPASRKRDRFWGRANSCLGVFSSPDKQLTGILDFPSAP